jgi:hypothetical protein
LGRRMWMGSLLDWKGRKPSLRWCWSWEPCILLGK